MTDVVQRIATAREGARELAKIFMRQSRCRWVDISIREGWSQTLEEFVRSAAMEFWRRHQELPPLRAFDRFPISAEDHEAVLGSGRLHVQTELESIVAARSAIKAEARRPFGERE